MIAHRVERTWQAREDRVAIVNHRRRLAMHQPWRADDLAAERLTDTLMAEADAENRDLAGHLAQNLQRDASFRRRTWSRRDNDCIGAQCAHAGDVDRVVAPYRDLSAELTEVLHEVVGKRIVVIYHNESNCFLHR